MLKRRREKKTDYRARLALVKSMQARLVVRRSLDNIHIQLVEYNKAGDATKTEVFSKKLQKYGWLYHGGSVPSAYLTGFLAGKMALSKGISSAFLDIGLQTSTKGSIIYAAALGAKEAGLQIPIGSGILPSSDRLTGRHISEYAKKLKEDPKKYSRQFSNYIKINLDPENIAKNFAEVKNKIIAEFGNMEDAANE